MEVLGGAHSLFFCLFAVPVPSSLAGPWEPELLLPLGSVTQSRLICLGTYLVLNQTQLVFEREKAPSPLVML